MSYSVCGEKNGARLPRKKKHSVISIDGEQFMSLTESHRKRVTQKIQDSHGHIAVTEVRHNEHDNDFENSAEKWVTISLGHTGYSRQLAVCLDREELNKAFSEAMAYITKTITVNALSPGIRQCLTNNLIYRESRAMRMQCLVAEDLNSSTYWRKAWGESVRTKSVFEMTATEFKDHVRPRAIELANDRWNKGLSLSVPAGEGYQPNQFFHIYKDKSVQLVEVEEKTGEVKFIKQIS